LLSSLALFALTIALLWAPAKASVRTFSAPFVEVWQAGAAGKEAVVGLWLLARDRAAQVVLTTPQGQTVRIAITHSATGQGVDVVIQAGQ